MKLNDVSKHPNGEKGLLDKLQGQHEISGKIWARNERAVRLTRARERERESGAAAAAAEQEAMG